MRKSYKIFGGKRPRSATHLLEAKEAQEAIDCKVSSGALKPFYNSAKDSDLDQNVLVRTIYYFRDSWLEWSADVDVAQGPVSENTSYPLYYTGDGIPKKTNYSDATTGSGAMPIKYYPMAVPKPVAAPTTGAPSGGSGDTYATAYFWRIKTSWGEYGPIGDADDPVDREDDATVVLSGLTLQRQASTAYTRYDSWVIPSGGGDDSVSGDYVYICTTSGTSGSGGDPSWPTTIGGTVTDGTVVWEAVPKGILYDSGTKMIYRSRTADNYQHWSYVGETAMANITFTDNKTASEIAANEILDPNDPSIDNSYYWANHPHGLTGIISSGDFFLGFSGKDIYATPIEYPHAWLNITTLDSDCVSLGIAGDGIFVAATEERPYRIVGTHPDSMSFDILAEIAKCLSKRSLVSAPMGAMWAVAKGLYLVSPSGAGLITEKAFTAEEWSEYYPSTMHAVWHDGGYWGYYSSGGNSGGVIIDFRDDLIIDLSEYYDDVYVDQDSDTLYYIKRTDEVLLQEDGTSYPSRTNAILLEDGSKLLLE
jgi:hypothetical protein